MRERVLHITNFSCQLEIQPQAHKDHSFLTLRKQYPGELNPSDAGLLLMMVNLSALVKQHPLSP